jgi:hypothetical protein
VDRIEHLSHKFVTVRHRRRAVYGLDDRSARRGLSIAAPLACTCVVRAVGALPSCQWGIDSASTLDWLLLDGGAVAGPAVDDDDSGVFFSTVAELSG